MAMSSPLEVGLITPWVNCWVTAAVATPMPPLTLPEELALALTTISLKSTRDFLNPIVPLLAILWPLMSSALLAAFKPEIPW